MSLKYHITNIPFEFEREICQRWNKAFRLRPSSSPFLSGDTYRSIADFLYDNTASCTAEQINRHFGQTSKPLVFVSSWRLQEFAENILPAVTKSFILITHQGDVNIVDSPLYRAIAENPHINHWFPQNCTLEHPKVTPLPIGLEDRWRHNAGALADFKKYTKQPFAQKKAKILLGFSLGTNPDARFACYRALWRHPCLHEIHQVPNAHRYRKLLNTAMFVASPAGNGLDCHRTWESMYLGVVPLVEDNYMNRYFMSLGLPLYCVSDWKEVAAWDEKKMEIVYHEIIHGANTKALWVDYWKRMVTNDTFY